MSEPNPVGLATALFTLTKLEWAERRRPEAKSAAKRSLAACNDRDSRLCDDVRDWIAAH